jgi:predicted enzyme related to lactoylglutathione lyase
MFHRIRALAVYVTDLGRAKEFYGRVLGFEVEADLGPTLCFLRSRTGGIHLYLEGGMKPGREERDRSRLGFFLQAERPASETLAELRRAGVRILQEAPEPVDDDTVCFQIADPDGNIIDVCCRP